MTTRLIALAALALAPLATPALADGQDAAANPLDQLLTSTKPMTQDPHAKGAPAALTSATTANCATQLTLADGSKMTVDLKTMQPMAVNTNLMITGGGKAVQMEFDGKSAAKDAASAEKLMSDLNDKCG